MSQNFSAVRKVSGKSQTIAAGNSCQGKPFIVNFMFVAMPVFISRDDICDGASS